MCGWSTAGRWRSPSSAPPRPSVLADDGTVRECRIALDGRRADDHRASLDRALRSVGSLSMPTRSRRSPRGREQASRPISDLRGSEAYRRHTVGVVARRAVEAAARRAAGESIAVPVNRGLGIGAASHEHDRDHAHRQRHRLPGRRRPAATSLSVLRTEIGLTGTKEGCDDCECGACMVLIDGRPVNSCSYLAVQARPTGASHDRRGCADRRRAAPAAAQHARGGRRAVRVLHARHAHVGARRCSPQPLSPPRRRSASACRGNLCRCTGYVKILAAVQSAAAAQQ